MHILHLCKHWRSCHIDLRSEGPRNRSWKWISPRVPRQVASVTTNCRASRIRLPPLMRSCTISAYLLMFVRKPKNLSDRLQFGNVEDILNPIAATSYGCRTRAADEELLLRHIKFHDVSLLAFSRSWRLLDFVSTSGQVWSDLYVGASIWFVETFRRPGKHQLASRVAAGSHCHLYLDFHHNVFGFNKQFLSQLDPVWWIIQMSCKRSWAANLNKFNSFL